MVYGYKEPDAQFDSFLTKYEISYYINVEKVVKQIMIENIAITKIKNTDFAYGETCLNNFLYFIPSNLNKILSMF